MAQAVIRAVTGFRSRPKEEPVLINGKPIKYRKVQKIAWPVGVGLFLGLVMSGIYFGPTQVHWFIHLGSFYWRGFDLKLKWDRGAGEFLSQHVWFIDKLNWSAYRHNYRDLGLPAYATVGVLSIVAGAKEPAGKLYTWLAPLLLTITAVLLITGATWVELATVDHLHEHGIYIGTVSVAEAIVIGFIVGRVLHYLFRPAGTSIQRLWIEWAVDRNHRKGRTTQGRLPVWVSLPLAPVTAREEGMRLINKDIKSGEAADLASKPLTWRNQLVWVAVAILLVLSLGFAFLGFIGHIWVGTLGYNFPYLAP